MRRSSVRAVCQLGLLLLLALAALTFPSARAQEPRPAPSPAQAEPPAAPSSELAKYNAQAVAQDGHTTTARTTAAFAAEHGADAAEADEQAADAAAADEQTAAAPTTTTASDAPAFAASDGPATPRPSALQGIVTLDVAVQETVRAGDTIDYTYSYRNTTASPISGIVVKAIWASFSPSLNSNLQFCDPDSNCDVLAGSVQGPAVSRIGVATNDGASYSVGTLAGGQSGRFTIRLRTLSEAYPKTNQAIIRPSGSGVLYLGGSAAPTSEDTATSLIIGPVFVLTMAALTTSPIYPLETGTFRISLGNATGSGDTPNGQIRADARPATTIVIRNVFPLGAEFVSATGSPVVDTNARTVTWTLPGPLNPGQTTSVEITFRRLNVDVGNYCDRLRNESLTVTSNEMPLSGAQRAVVYVQGSADVPVQVPMDIKSISVTPNNAVFGTEATLTIVVRNFWNQALTGARLNYDIQTNAFYVVGSATPTPTAAPNGTSLGGRVTWTFDMVAGSKTTPIEKTFSVRIRGSFSEQVSQGTFQLIAPDNVPGACLRSVEGRANFSPRLRLVKYSDAPESTIVNGIYIVTKNQEFPYIIEISNAGTSSATGINIVDTFPTETGANFSYVLNSATLNGTPYAPDSFSNGQGGSMRWNNLTVPAKSTLRIRYRLKVDGRDYYSYCNTASASASSGERIERSYVNVCVKINPKINVTKVTEPTRITAQPGEEVRFRLTLTNNETTTYRVGLFDYLGNFQFVRQESGYATPTAYQAGSNSMIWPATDLAPGQQVQAVIIARVPNVCETRDYSNEGMFHNETDIIRMIPSMLATVSVICGKLEYFVTSDRQNVSLRDRFVYTLELRNGDSQPASNVVVDHFLPQGFSYVGLDGSSDVPTAPTQAAQPDGRTKLSWTVTVAGQQTLRIRFSARSGDVVGQFGGMMTVSPTGRCISECQQDGGGTVYSARYVNVQPMATMEPQIAPTSCTLPGAKPTYKLTIVNTNTHDYTNTVVNLTLPFGLRFVRPINLTSAPTVTTSSTGVTTVTWSNIRIPAKPDNQVASQVVFEVELEVGQVWGDLATVVETTSPDGSIPRKEGTVNPTVPVCPPGPAIAKDATKRVVALGEEFMYQITLANTTASPLTVSVRDQLPENFSFVANVQGQATVNASTLTWSNVQVPAASNGKAGILILQFRVRVNSGTPGGVYPNTAQIISSPVAFNTTYSTINVRFPAVVYLPATSK